MEKDLDLTVNIYIESVAMETLFYFEADGNNWEGSH